MQYERRNVRFCGRLITVTTDEVVLPNGTRVELDIVHHPGVAAAIAIDAEDRVCLLRQFRYATDQWLWELPAGKLEAGETPLLTARRELAEEAGVGARDWVSLGSCLSSPGVLTEALHIFLATDLSPAKLAHEEGEIIEVHWVPFTSAYERAVNGAIADSKTAIGLIRAQHVRATKSTL